MAQTVRNCAKCQSRFRIIYHSGAGYSYCRSCRAEKSKRYWNTNRETIVASNYFSRIKASYGLSKDQLAQLIKRQSGRCAICKRKTTARLFVDHDHKTGAVRGLLCQLCNSVIGFWEDDSTLFRRAIEYLGGY